MGSSIALPQLTASVKEGGDPSPFTPKTRPLPLLPFGILQDNFTDPDTFETRLSGSFD